MLNELIKPPTTAERLLGRAVIAEKLSDFSLLASVAMRASDAGRILDWLASDIFAVVCRDAEVDAVAVSAQFHDLIAKGYETNVRYALT